MLGVGIEPDNRLINGEHRGQLQFCVPPMGIDGPSYRLRSHQARAENLRQAVSTDAR